MIASRAGAGGGAGGVVGGGSGSADVRGSHDVQFVCGTAGRGREIWSRYSGIGGLGHLGVQFAAKMGFHTVAIARGKDKEALARKLGARHYIDSETQDPAEELDEAGRGESNSGDGHRREGDERRRWAGLGSNGS